MQQTSAGALIADRYRLEARLGKGAFGEVWRAFDTHLNHKVALKFVLSKNRGATWHEASVLKNLRSEHILEVNNADMAGDVPYLDTALAECSLDKVAEPLGAEPRLAVTWMRRALRGLHLCHQRGLLHRDIKPSNLFLSSGGDALLGDFGVAALMDANQSAEPHGDALIQAPEFHTGARAAVASDIYSAACTLYHLLAGQSPFANATTADELERAKILAKYPPLRDLAPHVSRGLAGLVRKGMSPIPGDRFGSASEFDNALSIPKDARLIAPRAPHAGHDRCWEVTGAGSTLTVCVSPGKSATQKLIETRHADSNRRVTAHCGATTRGSVAKDLRRIFNTLR